MPKIPKRVLFQSTPPRREVTDEEVALAGDFEISIHTSPKGGDGSFYPHWCSCQYFNPHLPEGR